VREICDERILIFDLEDGQDNSGMCRSGGQTYDHVGPQVRDNGCILDHALASRRRRIVLVRKLLLVVLCTAARAAVFRFTAVCRTITPDIVVANDVVGVLDRF